MYFSTTAIIALAAFLPQGLAMPRRPFGFDNTDSYQVANTTYDSAHHPVPYTFSKRSDSLNFNSTCATVRSACQSTGDPNEAVCAAKAASCCDTSDDACRALPGANMSTCSAQKAACYSNAGLPDPYPSSRRAAAAESCSAVRSQCQSSGDPNEAECASEAAACCDKAHGDCISEPDANMSTCAAKKSACYVDASLPDPYSS